MHVCPWMCKYLYVNVCMSIKWTYRYIHWQNAHIYVVMHASLQKRNGCKKYTIHI